MSKGEVVLVIGGAGYIGAHTAKTLAEAGYQVVVYDNLTSGFREAVRWGDLRVGDIRDAAQLREVLGEFQPAAVVHFASLIEVGRSVLRPDQFYEVNVAGTHVLLQAMRDCGVERLVFSSSAAVYGAPLPGEETDRFQERRAKAPLSPYGQTKLVCEGMIADYARAFGMKAVALRYFNAAGADPSGLIGEAHDPETHLIPLALNAGLGLGSPLTVMGDDFPTPDGTCVRDYIHVLDLADAHRAALEAPLNAGAFEAVNVGTGQGASVLEVIAAVEAELGRPVPRKTGARRPGDPPQLVADPTLAERRLGWSAQSSSLERIVRDAATWARAPRYGPFAQR